MSRVLAYTSPARGHLYPLVPILDVLRGRGHEIHVRTLAAEVERLAARGFDAHPIDGRIEALEHDDWKANGARASLAASTAVFVSRAPLDADDLRAAIDVDGPGPPRPRHQRLGRDRGRGGVGAPMGRRGALSPPHQLTGRAAVRPRASLLPTVP